MFTGIVEEIGTVRGISTKGRVTVLTVECGIAAEGVVVGDSIAVNGACLTITALKDRWLSFDMMQETRGATTLGSLRPGAKVNCERSLKMGDRISGHFVSGHIDCVGLIKQKAYVRSNLCFEIGIPPRYSCYILPKGSIAVDGISLTIAGKRPGSFSVYVIPHTLASTTLGLKTPAQQVNVECDMLAKAAVSHLTISNGE
jgi:riboflavin synthase